MDILILLKDAHHHAVPSKRRPVRLFVEIVRRPLRLHQACKLSGPTGVIVHGHGPLVKMYLRCHLSSASILPAPCRARNGQECSLSERVMWLKAQLPEQHCSSVHPIGWPVPLTDSKDQSEALQDRQRLMRGELFGIFGPSAFQPPVLRINVPDRCQGNGFACRIIVYRISYGQVAIYNLAGRNKSPNGGTHARAKPRTKIGDYCNIHLLPHEAPLWASG